MQVVFHLWNNLRRSFINFILLFPLNASSPTFDMSKMQSAHFVLSDVILYFGQAYIYYKDNISYRIWGSSLRCLKNFRSSLKFHSEWVTLYNMSLVIQLFQWRFKIRLQILNKRIWYWHVIFKIWEFKVDILCRSVEGIKVNICSPSCHFLLKSLGERFK